MSVKSQAWESTDTKKPSEDGRSEGIFSKRAPRRRGPFVGRAEREANFSYTFVEKLCCIFWRNARA